MDARIVSSVTLVMKCWVLFFTTADVKIGILLWRPLLGTVSLNNELLVRIFVFRDGAVVETNRVLSTLVGNVDSDAGSDVSSGGVIVACVSG